jgi:hypothetical protein
VTPDINDDQMSPCWDLALFGTNVYVKDPIMDCDLPSDTRLHRR